MRRIRSGTQAKRAAAVLLLALATAAALLPIVRNEFTHFDDDLYITANPKVAAGMTAGGFRWALTSLSSGNWHPLTWYSHMLDVELFGLRPAGHHLSALVLHVGNSVLCFALLAASTGAFWRPLLVAALFALHPLHVESVAWAAERKDLLSTLLWLLALLAWGGYARRPGAGRYLAAGALFGLSLTAKAMPVTFPLLLLALDFWPLGRFRAATSPARSAQARRLVFEKLPFLALSAAVSLAAWQAQDAAGGLKSLAQYTPVVRLESALLGYVWYLRKMFWPSGLAVLYPHPAGGFSPWSAAGAAMTLVAVTALAVRQTTRRPWLAAGWSWYVVTLVPVAGLVQIGAQWTADRYSYFTLNGVFIILAWGAAEAARRAGTRMRGALAGAVVVGVALLGVTARAQTGVWKDGVTLFERAVAVAPDNAVGWNHLGLAYGFAGKNEDAVRAFGEALRTQPDMAEAWYNRGVARGRLGRNQESLLDYLAALRLNPGYVDARLNAAMAAISVSNWDLAWSQQRALLGFDPAAAARVGRIIAATAAMSLTAPKGSLATGLAIPLEHPIHLQWRELRRATDR